MGGKKLLNAKPLLDGFAYSMTEQDCGARVALRRLDVHRVELACMAGNGVARRPLVNARGTPAHFGPAENLIARGEKATDAGDGDGERDAVRPIVRAMCDGR